MIVIAIAATLGGAEGWVGVETFAKGKEDWLRSFPELPDGIASHDTFGRVFALLNHEQFAACLRQWSAAVAELIPDEILAVHGKTLRRSHNRGKGLAPLHVGSVWATGNGGARATGDGCEIQRIYLTKLLFESPRSKGQAAASEAANTG